MNSGRDSRSSDLLALPRPGDVIHGKYRIDSVIGTGGMGVVLGAADLSLNRPVAIKFLSPAKMQREDVVARFNREARAAASIQSEHVVRIYEIGALANGAPFIVMEHLRGLDLAHLLAQRGALGIDEACDLILQTCEALGEAHQLGIVHRDLKPQNLFLVQLADGSPCVKVLDFGISKAADDGSTPNLTSTDMVMGTPLYMSPEQVRSLKNVDARSDIWALGAILFELLTQSTLWTAPSASALCAMIAMDPPTPLRMRRPQAPPELEAVLLRCLHKDPAGRFADVAQLAEALAPFASERGRLSVTRISKVVRSSSPTNYAVGLTPPPPAYGASSPPGYGPSYPPGGYASTRGTGPTLGAPPQPPQLPPTQNTWNRSGTVEGRGTSGVLVAVLGLLTGLVLLGLAGGAYALYASRQHDAEEKRDAATPVPAATVAPTVVPTITAPVPTATATATVTAAPIKDAGAAPIAKKDAGVDPDAERNATLGKAAEQQCRYHQSQMGTFARDDASRKRAATSAKGFMCRGPASSRCERQVCKEACLVLGDQTCLQMINHVIDHGPPPKY